MKNEEKILGVLRRLGPGAGVCDDCLAEKAGVQPRQQVNQICRRLRAKGRISRENGNCSVANHAQGKILNFLSGQGDHSPELPKRSELPDLRIQTDVLSQWLFSATRFLDGVDPASSKEPFAGRISRLKKEDVLDQALARRMLTLNNFRVQVVKERIALDCTEWDLAEKYIGESQSAWKQSTH